MNVAVQDHASRHSAPGEGATERLSGAQIVSEYLVRHGVQYAVGIPGHGSWVLTDALIDRSDEIRIVQVMHEQSAVHLADGFYRASGKPLPALFAGQGGLA